MKDTVHSLLKDTLSLMKDPLFQEDFFLVSENCKHHFARPIEKPKQEKREPIKEQSLIPPSNHSRPPIAAKETTQPPSQAHIQAALQKLLPSLRLTEKIPDDLEGKKSANLWKEKIEGIEVVLLALSQDQETLELLKSLAKAIDSKLGSAKIISAERLELSQNWDLFFKANSFRLIVVSEGLAKYKHLSPFLKNRPFVSLENASTYKQIEKKATLWKTLCQMFQ